MDLDKIPDYLERLQTLIIGIPILIGLVVKAWADLRESARKLAELREESLWDAAQYLWHRGQTIKRELDALGKSRGDLPARLRDLAPGALEKFGVRHGVAADDIAKVLDLARVIHHESKPTVRAVPGLELPAPDPLDAPGASPSPGASSPASGTDVLPGAP